MMMKIKTYATFDIGRSFRQAVHALRSREEAQTNMALLFDQVKQHEKRIEQKLGRPLQDLRMLEIGVGQGMERALYFGIQNTVIGMDLDVIPRGFDIPGYFRMIRNNGFGRFLKTIGRRLIIAGPNRNGWVKAVGTKQMTAPEILYGDICETVPDIADFDVVMSWSVFEHLPDPRMALKNVIQALRPGGVLFISIHIFTSNNGHHDIRAFTGQEDELPLWGHLRPQTQGSIHPSSYLNEWRLEQWRKLFTDLAPGHDEYLETHDDRYAAFMSDELRNELRAFSDDELYTVDVIYVWRKPVEDASSKKSDAMENQDD